MKDYILDIDHLAGLMDRIENLIRRIRRQTPVILALELLLLSL